MKYRIMKRLAILFFTIISGLGVWASTPQEKMDSIEHLFPMLKLKERLNALTSLYYLANSLRDSLYEQDILRRLFHEAEYQGDTNLAGFAYSALMYSYDNYKMFDRLKSELPHALAYQSRIGNMQYYYYTRDLLISLLLRQGQRQEAVQEMQAMYADARVQNNWLGQALALTKMAEAYVLLYADFRMAVEVYKNAIELFTKAKYITSNELDTYFSYAYSLLRLERYKELPTFMQYWKHQLEAKSRDCIEDVNRTKMQVFYANYYAISAVLELYLENADKAREYNDSLRVYAGAIEPRCLPVIHIAQEAYFNKYKLFDSALYYNAERIRHDDLEGNILNKTQAIYSRANLFLQLAKYDSAALLFNKYILLQNNELRSKVQLLLNEFHAQYKVAELKDERTLARLSIYVLLGLLLSLSIFLLGLRFVSSHLRKKNRLLYEAIRRRNGKSQNTDSLPVEDAATLSDEQRQYLALCRLMQEDKLFQNVNLTRNEIAERLSMSQTALAELVQRFENGISLTEFLNRRRIDFAAQSIAAAPQTELATISYTSGFNSAITFNNLFKGRFGVSAAEFRQIALEQQLYEEFT